jgi:hypothetical protein
MDHPVIVEVGAEGGGVALLGRLDVNQDWEFRLSSTDESLTILGDEVETRPSSPHESDWVLTWPEAVALLDRYPWAQLVPLVVHPVFRDEVLVEVTRRLLGRSSPRSKSQMDRWLKLCSGGIRERA